jgi:hypothetical protein
MGEYTQEEKTKLLALMDNPNFKSDKARANYFVQDTKSNRTASAVAGQISRLRSQRNKGQGPSPQKKLKEDQKDVALNALNDGDYLPTETGQGWLIFI